MKYFATFILCLTLITFGQAQIPRTLSYQGVLTDSSGTPRADASYNFTFSLYDSGSGGMQLWSEAKSLKTKRGLFSTALGDATPFTDSLKFDRPYWLNISVSGIGELSPRVALTSVGYSMNALRSDTARVALTAQGDNMWKEDGSNIFYQSGNVGIGTSNPTKKLHVAGEDPDLSLDIDSTSANNLVELQFKMNDQLKSRIYWSKLDNKTYIQNMGASPMVFDDGNVGIKTTTPEHELQIGSVTRGISFEAGKASPNAGAIRFGDGTGWKLHFGVSHSDTGALQGTHRVLMTIVDKGNVGIGTMSPSAKLHVVGRTITDVLEITGGSDLAEPFEMSHEQVLEPGSVVIIDEEHPGQLKLSDHAYDRRVAGVVSGAGGIKPGLTLNQTELTETGQNVALSGRVYVKVTASNGPIAPGDLLTTSDLPGHAMRASDEKTKPGMTIGKAMSALNEGTGLVLVLVNLQ